MFVAIAGVSLALAAMTWRGGDRSLLWFAIFTMVYGLRMVGSSLAVQAASAIPQRVWDHFEAALSHVILVPAGLLAAAHLGRGWHDTLWLFPRFAAIVGVLSISVELVTDAPDRAMPLNRLLVLAGLVLVAVHVIPRWREASASRLRPVLWAAAVFAAFALYETFAPTRLLGRVDLEPLALLAVVAALGHYSASGVLANQARLAAVAAELATARRIQQSILPQSLPSVHELSLAARYVPMSELAGDFYDFIPLNASRIGMLVADVSGHGVPAALIASMVKVAVSAQSHHAGEPSRLLEAVNHTFLGRFDGSFITAFYAVIDTAAGAVTYSSAGHPPAFVVRASQRIESLPTGGLMLGFMDAPYPQDTAAFAPGDRLVLYTDGLIEAAAPHSGEFFGDRELPRALREGISLDTNAFADMLLRRAKDWTVSNGGTIGDDLTLLVADRAAST